MLKLRTFSEAPPFLRYRVPESGEVIPPVGQEVHNYNDLEDAVRAHYRANQLKVPANLPALIQDQLCRQIPSRFCSDENGNVLRDGSTIFGFNFDVVKQGTATLVDWFVRGGAEKVSTEETTRRSKICSTCAFNQPVPGCSSCNSASLHGLVNKIVGVLALPTDAALNGCSICGCSLKAKVRLPLDVLLRHTSPEQLNKFPAHFWMKESL